MCMVVVLSRLLMPSWTVWVVDWGWRLNCDIHGERLTYYLRSMSKCGKKTGETGNFAYEQQNVITQLMAVIKNSGEDPEEYLSTVSDPAVRERLLLKHGGSSDLSESDILGAFGTSEDSKYQGFQYASKYIDPSTASEASRMGGSQSRESCERDIEVDRLSANLHKASTTTSTSSARDVYKTLSSIRNSPLRKRDLGALSADSTSTFDPDSYKLSSYDEFAKVVVAPAPPDRGISEPSDYTDSNYLGHTVEERQKGHALTPVTEISPEYATSDTAGNGEGQKS
ncbi:uncharacterized protein CEXT_607171 [Caerostris extrusa]|uniref:Uncharacterized protein n=1 Tax=Caerostris extrusa TaxID=172846 RepID=A0AAV4NKB1_CAEEX|nr:uncharacterized protein CEXT_607171 [Caerostris extrusa]